MAQPSCRACGGVSGDLVLDLGLQPPADLFPRLDEPGPDPAYPLEMWLCSSCGLAQLLSDPTSPEEPRGAEPAALVAQAADAVERVSAGGLLPATGSVVEYGSPHGGSWLELLSERGLSPAAGGGRADVVLDCFGMMHAHDQGAALAERTDRVAEGGVLLLQYHSLGTIVRLGQWNSLRHGHFAYYSTAALDAMLAGHGFGLRTAWQFDLYGGTVLLAAARDADGNGRPDASVLELLSQDDRDGVREPTVLSRLQQDAEDDADGLRAWLEGERDASRSVLGYGAASRAVALLVKAGVGRSLLPAVVDASPAKQGRRMPGTDVPIVEPAALGSSRPDSVLLFLPDLEAEVRRTFPEVEQSGGRWVDASALGR